MKINKKGIPGVLPDNEVFYFYSIINLIESIDDEAELNIIATLRGYSINIKPMDTDSKESILITLQMFNEELGIDAEYCKTQDFLDMISYEIIIPK